MATTERRFEQRSESFVNVPATAAGSCVGSGGSGTLGREEAIQAVRCIGDVGFVVTFRRIDPLYTSISPPPPAPG